eukprot:65085_1
MCQTTTSDFTKTHHMQLHHHRSQGNYFSILADTTISNILTWLLPHERLLCAKICALFRDNVYSFIAFSDIWICHNPWIESKRFGFAQSTHYRGYNNAFLLNLLPYGIRKHNYDKYLTQHQELQASLTIANDEFGCDFDEKEDYAANEKRIIDTHPPQPDSEYHLLRLLHHVRCLSITNDAALTLFNLSQPHPFTRILSKSIRFLIVYLPHPALCYKHHRMKQCMDEKESDEDAAKDMKLLDMTCSIQMGLDVFTKSKYVCLVELNTYYISSLNFNKFHDLSALHLYAIDKALDWELFLDALSNKEHKICAGLLLLSLEHCASVPIKLCQHLFESCENIKHLTLIRNHFHNASHYLRLPSTIASLVWFKNQWGDADMQCIVPVFEHCAKLYQVFMSYTEIAEVIPLFFGRKHAHNHSIKQIWIIDQRIEIPITDLVSDDSDEDEKEVTTQMCNNHKPYQQREVLDVFVRDIWRSKVEQKLQNMVNCVVYPIPCNWHSVNPHFTINQCSFLTTLRHCTDCFCIDDVVYDGV